MNRDWGSKPNEPRRLIALYDSECNLCLATKGKLEKLNSAIPVEWRSIQSCMGEKDRLPPALANLPLEQLLSQMHVIEEAGGSGSSSRLHSGSEGVMRLLRNVPSMRWIGIVGEWPGFRGMSRLLYKLIARHRYRLFGKNDSCSDGVCSLPQTRSQTRSQPQSQTKSKSKSNGGGPSP
ncbi:thiol-disulfide oxidoreductase DCC family protein [Cohnella fermenti]|uniref:DUF393 domain-containing protein n=1 Tax=Cohnella fermenti TaxID=2565925 RepID=A0A4S4C7G2_9BACL|nr:DUF393 domain-containing protein [Cohnella fermenti]THF83821.1 DUF393 domain-containing protein [Cohnella fermenti]